MGMIRIQDIKKFERLDILAKQVVEGFIIGLHKSPFHGFSVEFAEHRLYNEGESTKDMDWKVYARTDKLFVKKFEEETNLRCYAALDISSSMYFPYPEKSGQLADKMRFSILSIAALFLMLKKQRDAFGLAVFDEEIQYQSRCRNSQSHFDLMLASLEKWAIRNEQKIGTNAAHCLHELAEKIHKRSLIVIFSDMLDDHDREDKTFGALQHMKHNKHEVVLFHVLDHDKELDFEWENKPYEFVDLESNISMKLRPAEIKERYQEAVKKTQQRLKMKCLQYGIDYVPTNSNEPFDKILMAYLIKRKKMVK